MKQIIEVRPGSAEAIKNGDKVITIQKGKRIYNLGSSVLLDPLTNETIEVEVLGISYCKIQNTSVTNMVLHGEKNAEQLLNYLQQYYPKIKSDNTITIIRYCLKKEKKNNKTVL